MAGGGDSPGTAGGVVEISWLGLGLAAALILVQGAVSLRLGLGMHSQLLTAGVRCVVQLSLLGTILVPIFNYGQLWLVLAYAAFMVWISAVEAIGRPTRYYKGMFSNTLLIIAVCASSTMVYALLLIIGVQPWWSPQYLIPILGMVLGNTISGISIGLSSVIEELSSGKDQIERLLALGASRSEATADLVGRSVKLAMTPLLNQMSVVGLVSIPGMMTGQILSGSNPDQAARYQMVIMFLLGAAAAAAAVASVYAAVLQVVDSCHRLRPERLIQRSGKAGVNGFINNTATQVINGVVWLWTALTSCCTTRDRTTQPTAGDSSSGSSPRNGGSSSRGGSSGAPADLRQPLLQGEGGETVGGSNSSSRGDEAAAGSTAASSSSSSARSPAAAAAEREHPPDVLRGVNEGSSGERIEVVTDSGGGTASRDAGSSAAAAAGVSAAAGLKGAPPPA